MGLTKGTRAFETQCHKVLKMTQDSQGPVPGKIIARMRTVREDIEKVDKDRYT